MKSLIIYFSRADENYAVGYIDKGNTEYVAEFVQELTGADMFKVEPAVPYAADYRTCIEEAKQRIGNAPIKEKLTDISAYDTVFIMSPIYWGTYAPELETALEGLDFTGKTVRFICTHEGSDCRVCLQMLSECARAPMLIPKVWLSKDHRLRILRRRLRDGCNDIMKLPEEDSLGSIILILAGIRGIYSCSDHELLRN